MRDHGRKVLGVIKIVGGMEKKCPYVQRTLSETSQ